MSTNIKISALPTKTRIAAGDFVAIVDNDGVPTTKKVHGDAFTPVGTYIQFAGASTPAGYLACDGSAVSRTTYADLFAVVSTTYGVGNGSTTFNLPDARGLVMVGAGANGTLTRADASAYDGGTVGASRNDQMQGHVHTVTTEIYTAGSTTKIARGNSSPESTASTGAPATDGVNGTPRTGNETRPAEIAVLVCIKF